MRLLLALLLVSFPALAERPPKAVRDEKRAIEVSRKTAKFEWPLSEDAGWLECVPSRAKGHRIEAVIFYAMKKSYAVNGIALEMRKVQAIDPIWKPHEKIPGAKANLGPLLDLGLDQCRKAG